MIPTGAVIGIWGFGITGKANAQFFHARGHRVSVLDSKDLTPEEQQLITHLHASYTHQKDVTAWFESVDVIIPSAGIDIRAYYEQYKHKFVFELDIFAQHAQLPITAISGSLGKTTVTTLLSQLMSAYKSRVLTGGNIGVATLDLIAQQEQYERFILEVSDVQLKYTHMFAPDLAILTTFTPNHLVWHGSVEEYFRAKCQLFVHQKSAQQALIPFELAPSIRAAITLQSHVSYFHPQPLTPEQAALVAPSERVFFIQDAHICMLHNNKTEYLASLDDLPAITFAYNWLIVVSALYLHGFNVQELPQPIDHVHIPEHRLQKIACINSIEFYDDSKSTVSASTLAAVAALGERKIRLLLGGLSKGINREPLVAALAGKVAAIYCFGAEHEELFSFCTQHTIPAHAHETLELAFQSATREAQPNDIILLSPAGSSFDLFLDYKARGKCFQALVFAYRAAHTHSTHIAQPQQADIII